MTIALTSYQIIGSLIVACIGFLFRLGLEYRELKKMPKFAEIFVLAIFSFGASSLMFLYVINRQTNVELKLLLICATSFFGSVIVPGVGAIKPSFFTSLAKNAIRNWVNGQSNTEANESDSDRETEQDSEVQPDSENDRDLEQ